MEADFLICGWECERKQVSFVLEGLGGYGLLVQRCRLTTWYDINPNDVCRWIVVPLRSRLHRELRQALIIALIFNKNSLAYLATVPNISITTEDQPFL